MLRTPNPASLGLKELTEITHMCWLIAQLFPWAVKKSFTVYILHRWWEMVLRSRRRGRRQCPRQPQWWQKQMQQLPFFFHFLHWETSLLYKLTALCKQNWHRIPGQDLENFHPSHNLAPTIMHVSHHKMSLLLSNGTCSVWWLKLGLSRWQKEKKSCKSVMKYYI